MQTNFDSDFASYNAALMTDPGYSAASGAVVTGFPTTALADAAANPALFLASLAQESDDQPSWFTAMPTSVQKFWESAGSQVIDMYTSEVDAARPLPSLVSASLSSLSSSQFASASSVASEASASASSVASGASASAIHQGAAPASPATAGRMMVVGAGVAIAASLVGMALL